MEKRIVNRTFDEITIGEKGSISRTITADDILQFAIVSGDVNPAHLDAEYAKGTIFKDVIAHGMWSAGLISAVVGVVLPGPGTIYLKQSFKFKRPVHVGDTITATVEVTARDEEKKHLTLFAVCTNQDGQAVVESEATVMAPTIKVDRPAPKLPRLVFASD